MHLLNLPGLNVKSGEFGHFSQPAKPDVAAKYSMYLFQIKIKKCSLYETCTFNIYIFNNINKKQ